MSRHQVNCEAALMAEARARRLGMGALEGDGRAPAGCAGGGPHYTLAEALGVALRLGQAEPDSQVED